MSYPVVYAIGWWTYSPKLCVPKSCSLRNLPTLDADNVGTGCGILVVLVPLDLDTVVGLLDVLKVVTIVDGGGATLLASGLGWAGSDRGALCLALGRSDGKAQLLLEAGPGVCGRAGIGEATEFRKSLHIDLSTVSWGFCEVNETRYTFGSASKHWLAKPKSSCSRAVKFVVAPFAVYVMDQCSFTTHQNMSDLHLC